MKFTEWMRRKILKLLGLEKLAENPKSNRLMFISNNEDIKLEEAICGKIWYIGDSNQLLNYYTERRLTLVNNPIFNRNIENYFWAKSAEECDIKRVHSGVARAIIDTISNVIGKPEIDEPTGMWEKIAEENDFEGKLTQQGRVMTLAQGWGAWKININKEVSDYPLLEYYEAENCEYIVKSGIVIGIVFKSYYKNKKQQDFVLLETRYRANGNSYTEYQLCRVEGNDNMTPCDFAEIEELAYLGKDNNDKQVIEGLNMMLAVPSRYFYSALDPEHGDAFLSGKYDALDMLDEIMSQASQTNRVSTPVEYYSSDIVFRDKNGNPGVPKLYNRQYMQKEDIPDGDGNLNTDIVTTQPDLNFDKYGNLMQTVLDYIFTGKVSPATMGVDIAKKDNAEAQREKEKVTIMTRNNIITQETRMVKQIVKICLYLKEFMDKGTITLTDNEVSVKYNEFANPAFENMLETYGNAWNQGEISTKKYVELLWAGKLTEEEQAQEIAWLDEHRKQDEFDLEGMLKTNENAISGAMDKAANDENEFAEPEEQVPSNNL